MKKCCPEDLPLISVIIVNWNGAKFLAKCLAALKAQTFKSFEIIIIDNGSNDRSVDNLETTWPEVRVERLKKNKGFAAANNLGARLAKGTWLALINYDAFPTPGWLQALSDASIKFSEFSFFASYLVMAERNNYTDGMGDIYNVCGMAWRRGHGKPMDIFKQKEIEVFGPCAAAAFYPRELFLKAGGFDEDYFCYHEDVDMAFRLRLQGHRCLFVPDAVVKHVGSGSHGSESDFVRYFSHRNLVWTYVKNMPGVLVWWYLPAHLLFNLISIFWFLGRGQGNTICRAKKDAMLGLRKVIHKRRQIQQTRKIHFTQIKTIMDRHWINPYLKPHYRTE